MHQIAFGGRALPGPAGGAHSAPPDPSSCIGGGEGSGVGGRKGEGRGMEGEGEGEKVEWKGGEGEGKGPHPLTKILDPPLGVR